MVIPVGYSARPGAAALLAKMSGFVEMDAMHDQEGEPIVAAPIPRPDATPWSLAEITTMAAAEAFAELSVPSVGEPAAGEPTWICINHGPPDADGSSPLGSYVLDRVETAVQGLRPARDSVVRAGDHTAVLEGLAEGAERIRRGAVRACLVGGTESLVSEARVAALDAAGTLKTGYSPHGITPGEASAFVLIESAEQARARGAQPLAVIAGTGQVRGASWVFSGAGDKFQPKYPVGTYYAGDWNDWPPPPVRLPDSMPTRPDAVRHAAPGQGQSNPPLGFGNHYIARVNAAVAGLYDTSYGGSVKPDLPTYQRWAVSGWFYDQDGTALFIIKGDRRAMILGPNTGGVHT